MASNLGKPPLGYLNNGHKFSSSNLDEISIAESHTPGGARKGLYMRHNVGNRGPLDLRSQMNSDQLYDHSGLGANSKSVGKRIGMKQRSVGQRNLRNHSTS